MKISSAINRMKKTGLPVTWNQTDYRYEVNFGKGSIRFSPNGKHTPDAEIVCFEVVDNRSGMTWLKPNMAQALKRLTDAGLNN